ncbi:DUF2163 domain-containing protein [Croceicoccus naphthovorans]|uniref:Bacteriophage phiJL001 Gp84 C-terminal domain-containing protein n=1 Tax=Croceicoccus naphthovorans TaxID=1348774 RepID=A0A0G3XGW6_9SPHN|nr:DUF2163 domain-containing protein [Croceicoccus naphthovorans]AKM09881.1 hypothetical protein AB433_07605 [Croceicoccus naphthovorans]MBB3991341.1 putative phage protein (TIGR02218 family) [Croceicoccus naphthovorans]
MARTLDPLLDAALAQSPRKGAEIAIVESRQGNRQRLTTWDRPLSIDLGLGDGTETCTPGMMHSAITLAAGMDASHFEMSGPIGGAFTEERVLGGYWRSARVWLGWTSPGVADPLPVAALMAGRVGEYRVEGRRWVLEVRNAADGFNQSIGRVLSPYCTHDYGDAKCTKVRTPYACEVTYVASSFSFAVDIGGEHPDDFFEFGDVTFDSGALAGLEGEVFRFTGDTASVELLAPMPVAPQVGDTLTLYRGCSKLRLSDDPTLPTCLTNENVINFGGHPEVPGTEQYFKIASPGTGVSRRRGTLGGDTGGLTSAHPGAA